MGSPILPIWQQSNYAFYEDGSESGSTIIGTAGAQQDITADTIFQFRALILETNGANKDPQLDTKLQYNKEDTGWVDVSTTTPVQYVDSSNIAHGDDTTHRLGTGAWFAGETYEYPDALLLTGSSNGNDETNCLYILQIDSAQASAGDEILLRVVESDGTLFGGAYTNADINVVGQPDVTVSATGQGATAVHGTAAAVNTDAILSATGQGATATKGDIIASGDAIAEAVGQVAISVHGTVIINTDSIIAADGQAVIAEYGDVVATGSSDDVTIPVTGIEATASKGDVIAFGSTPVIVSAIGQGAAAAHGSVAISTDAIIDATGQGAASNYGTATVSQGTGIDVPVTGQGATAEFEAVTVVTHITAGWGRCAWNTGAWNTDCTGGDVVIPALGRTLTANYGTVTVLTEHNIVVNAVGQGATATYGDEAVSTSVVVNATGQGAAAVVGDVVTSISISTAVTGIGAVAEFTSTTVNVDYSVQATGQGSIATQGSVTVQTGGSISIGVSGQEATAGFSGVTVATDYTVQVSGQAAAASPGVVTVSTSGNIVVNAVGQQAAAAHGTAISGAGVVVDATGQGAIASYGIAIASGEIYSPTGWGRCGWNVGAWNRNCFSNVAVGQDALAFLGAVVVTTTSNVIIESVGQGAIAENGSVDIFHGDTIIEVEGIGAIASHGEVLANYDHLHGICGDIASYAISERAIADTCYDIARIIHYSDPCIISLTVKRGITSLTEIEPEYEIEKLPVIVRDIESLTLERSILHDNDCQC